MLTPQLRCIFQVHAYKDLVHANRVKEQQQVQNLKAVNAELTKNVEELKSRCHTSAGERLSHADAMLGAAVPRPVLALPHELTHSAFVQRI